MRARWTWIAVAAGALAAAGCMSNRARPIDTVSSVDLPRYMGDWYVIANIPPFIEKGAHNSRENYRLDPDGTIATTFTYRADSFDGPQKKLTSRAFVLDTQTNAVWGVQFIWPIKADYRIIFLSPDYDRVVVGREKRDYLWLMARTPEIPDEAYRRMVDAAAAQGYDVSRIRKVPQRWN